MRRLGFSVALVGVFLAGWAAVWLGGAAFRAQQAALREARVQASLVGWRSCMAAHPANREAQAWVAALSAPPPAASVPAPPPPRQPVEAPKSARELQLRAEIARLQEEFTARSAAARSIAQAQKAAIASTPEARLPVPPLPPSPTAADVDAYLMAVQRRLEPLHSFRDNDPDVALLRAVPPAFLEQLLAAATTTRVIWFRSLTATALPELVTPEQRDLVLRWLPRFPELITVIERRQWTEPALPILRAQLSSIRQMESQLWWVRVLAKAGDTADFPLLQATILESSYGYWQHDLCREVERLPGFPIKETVTACWAARNKTNGSSAFLPLAAEYGAYDALARIVACVAVREPYFSIDKAEKWLTEHTDAPDEPQTLLRWLGTAEDPPVYDAVTRRWSRSLPKAGF